MLIIHYLSIVIWWGSGDGSSLSLCLNYGTEFLPIANFDYFLVSEICMSSLMVVDYFCLYGVTSILLCYNILKYYVDLILHTVQSHIQ